MMPPSQSSEDFAMRIVETCARKAAGAVVEVAHFSPESAARAIDRAREIARSIGVRIDHVTLRVMGAKRQERDAAGYELKQWTGEGRGAMVVRK